MIRPGGSRQSGLPLGSGTSAAFQSASHSSTKSWRAVLRRHLRWSAALATTALALLLVLSLQRGSDRHEAAAAAAQLGSVRASFGIQAPEDEPQCWVFRPQAKELTWTFNIAIIGKEPLVPAYQHELLGMNLTVRLDSLSGFTAGEPFTTWLIQAPHPDSATLAAAEAVDRQVLEQGKAGLESVLVVGGQRDRVTTALQQRLGTPGPDMVHLPGHSWYKRHWLDLPAGGPSTGYIALRMALQCKPSLAMLHLYGFPRGWRKDHGEAVKTLARSHDDPEAAILLTLDCAKVTIHETAAAA